MLFLQRLLGKKEFPQLLGFGTLNQEVAQGISDYLVISPMGQLLGEDVEPELVLKVFQDISFAIMELHRLGILHRCVITSNTNCRIWYDILTSSTL